MTQDQVVALAIFGSPIIFAAISMLSPVGALYLGGIAAMYVALFSATIVPVPLLAAPAVLFVGGAVLVAMGAGLHAITRQLQNGPMTPEQRKRRDDPYQ